MVAISASDLPRVDSKLQLSATFHGLFRPPALDLEHSLVREFTFGRFRDPWDFAVAAANSSFPLDIEAGLLVAVLSEVACYLRTSPEEIIARPCWRNGLAGLLLFRPGRRAGIRSLERNADEY
eukprot:3504431-Amphidinium_carterae.1